MNEVLNLHFAYPWALATPLLLGLLRVLRRSRVEAVVYSDTRILEDGVVTWRTTLRRPLLFLTGSLAVVLLAIAAARPQRVLYIPEKREARNIMVALDISRSMARRDFQTRFGWTTRLDAVKEVVSEFIKQRAGDRIGLVVFGSTAYLQAPLTFDHQLVSEFVQSLRVGLAGDETAIGDGLGLCLKRMQALPEKSQAVILLTDGLHNAGQVNPRQAGRVARALGITVHTVGIGDYAGGVNEGRRREAAAGLRRIARVTGGEYFEASDLDGLAEVYRSIDALERSPSEDPLRRITEELFEPYAVGALACYAFYLVLAYWVFLRVP